MFDVDSEDILPKLPRSEFIKYLPYLLVPQKDGTFNCKPWYDVCIDPRVAVLIVDDKTGEVIHRVPPIIYTTTELTGKKVSQMLTEYGLRKEANPLLGESFAKANFDEDLILAEPPEEDVELWRWIMGEYGYGPVVGTTKESLTIAAALGNADDDW